MNKLKKYLSLLEALLVGVIGSLSIIHIQLFRFTRHGYGVNVPHNLFIISRLATSASGLLLIYVSLQLFNRKHRAWQLSLVGLGSLLGLSLLRRHNILLSLLYALTLIVLVVSQSIYSVRSDNYNMRRGLGVAGALLLAALAYGTFGFYFLEKRDLGIDFSFLRSLKYAIGQMTFQHQVTVIANTEHARLFLDSINIVSLSAYFLAFVSLFKPIRFATSSMVQDRQRALEIIQEHSTSVEDYFKIWPYDKHYFFNKSGTAVIAYKVSNGIALILDGPSGSKRTFKVLLKNFTNFAVSQGWRPAVIHGDKPLAEYLEDDDYKPFYIGSEALVDVQKFATSTYRIKHFRYIQNKAERDNLAVEFWNAPLSDTQIAQLRTISNQWIGQEGRREYTFMLGYFDTEYIRHCDVAVLMHEHQPMAYTNIIPSFVPAERSIDHIRHVPSMPSQGMHYLLQQLILHVHEQHVTTFNLGLSPLSRLDHIENPNISERLLKIITRIGSQYYSFKGLEQFKNKFEPNWEPRYFYYRGSPTNIVKITKSLTNAMAVPKPAIGKRLIAITVLSIIAALCYISFPLGYLLKLDNGHLVSALGEKNAPYANLFNAFDILSSLAMISTSFVLYYKQILGKIEKHILFSYFMGGAGGLVAAVVSLPTNQSDLLIDSQTLLHVLSSAVNVLGIASATILITWFYRRKSRAVVNFFILYIFWNVIAVILGRSSYGPVVQRIQIVLTSIWIFLVPYLLVKLPETLGINSKKLIHQEHK